MGGRVAFVYGTLMAPEVVQALIKRVPPMRPATLRGFCRYCVKGQVYPAIVPETQQGAEVRGQVLLELTEHEVAVLDAYESIEYFRQTVEPVLEDGTQVTADVYVWKEEYKPLLELVEWGYEEFRQNHLAAYMESTTEFMQTEFMQELAGAST